jgi:type II secretory pathway component GspD/PulD (secretin)
LEVLLIDHNAPVDGKEGASAPSAADLAKLHKQGKLERVVRAQLASVDGNPARVQIGERVPVATARNVGGFGRGGAPPEGRAVSYSYTIESIGTLINATTRIEDGGAVLVDLQVERSQLASSDRPPDEAADAVGRQKTVSLTSQSTLRLKPGEPAIAEAWQSSSGQETSGVFIVVTAQVEAGGPRRAAAAAADGIPQLRVFALRNAKAGNAQRILTNVLAEKLGDKARTGVDEATNSVIVYATPQQQEIVGELFRMLDADEK